MVIVSPYAKRGYTDSRSATFASILRFTEETFSLSALGTNDLNAYDYMQSFDFTLPATGARVAMTQHAVPAASHAQIAAAPPDPDDPT